MHLSIALLTLPLFSPPMASKSVRFPFLVVVAYSLPGRFLILPDFMLFFFHLYLYFHFNFFLLLLFFHLP